MIHFSKMSKLLSSGLTLTPFRVSHMNHYILESELSFYNCENEAQGMENELVGQQEKQISIWRDILLLFTTPEDVVTFQA